MKESWGYQSGGCLIVSAWKTEVFGGKKSGWKWPQRTSSRTWEHSETSPDTPKQLRNETKRNGTKKERTKNGLPGSLYYTVHRNAKCQRTSLKNLRLSLSVRRHGAYGLWRCSSYYCHCQCQAVWVRLRLRYDVNQLSCFSRRRGKSCPIYRGIATHIHERIVHTIQSPSFFFFFVFCVFSQGKGPPSAPFADNGQTYVAQRIPTHPNTRCQSVCHYSLNLRDFVPCSLTSPVFINITVRLNYQPTLHFLQL